MSTTYDKIVSEAVSKIDFSKVSVQEAANALLEGIPLTAGSMVAVIDDPTYPAPGQKGKVKGPSSKGSGWTDVELANGTVMPMQSSLLIPL